MNEGGDAFESQLPNLAPVSKRQPKPHSPRITFTTYKWYSKYDPLFESGLLGPVTLRLPVRVAVRRAIDV